MSGSTGGVRVEAVVKVSRLAATVATKAESEKRIVATNGQTWTEMCP